MLTEDQGVEAIQFLLGLNNQTEPQEVSRKNWQTFAGWEKERTEMAYYMFKPEEEDDRKEEIKG